MRVMPEAIMAAAIDLRTQMNEVHGTLETAMILLTRAALEKGDVDDQATRAVVAERARIQTALTAEIKRLIFAYDEGPAKEALAELEAGLGDLLRQEAGDSDTQPDPYIDTMAAEHVSEYEPDAEATP